MSSADRQLNNKEYYMKEIKISNAFGKEMQPDNTFVITLDGYDGCQLQCPYCFQMKNSEWSKEIFIRVNIAEVLDKQIKENQSIQKGTDLFIGSLSDPYMQLEETYQLTREMLEVLWDKEYSVHIVTKADNRLILRDLDLFKRFRNPIKILLGLSNLKQAAKDADNTNIAVANELKSHGVDVDVFITPVIPYIMNIDSMINALDSEIKIYLDKLRVFKEGNQDKKMYDWVKKEHPHYLRQYNKILFEKDESYCTEIVNKYKLNDRITFMLDLWGR